MLILHRFLSFCIDRISREIESYHFLIIWCDSFIVLEWNVWYCTLVQIVRTLSCLRTDTKIITPKLFSPSSKRVPDWRPALQHHFANIKDRTRFGEVWLITFDASMPAQIYCFCVAHNKKTTHWDIRSFYFSLNWYVFDLFLLIVNCLLLESPTERYWFVRTKRE